MLQTGCGMCIDFHLRDRWKSWIMAVIQSWDQCDPCDLNVCPYDHNNIECLVLVRSGTFLMFDFYSSSDLMQIR